VVTLYIAHSAIEITPQYFIHLWFWSSGLMVLVFRSTGSGLQVYWFWSSGLLVLVFRSTGSGLQVYWFWSSGLLVLVCRSTGFSSLVGEAVHCPLRLADNVFFVAKHFIGLPFFLLFGTMTSPEGSYWLTTPLKSWGHSWRILLAKFMFVPVKLNWRTVAQNLPLLLFWASLIWNAQINVNSSRLYGWIKNTSWLSTNQNAWFHLPVL